MKNLFTLLLSVSPFFGMAQQTPNPFDFKTAVSFNPTVLAPVDNTIMLGAEYALKNRLALVLDAGYIFYSGYFQAHELEGVKGFAIRPGLKFYGNKEKSLFYQFQVSYKQADYKLHDWLGKDCVNGIPAYEELQQFTYRKKTVSFNTLAGWMFRLSDGLLLELYGGVGIKIKDQGPTERGACYRSNERGFIYSPFKEHSVSANLPFGIKLLVPV